MSKRAASNVHRGTATLELALTLPLVTLLTWGVIEAGELGLVVLSLHERARLEAWEPSALPVELGSPRTVERVVHASLRRRRSAVVATAGAAGGVADGAAEHSGWPMALLATQVAPPEGTLELVDDRGGALVASGLPPVRTSRSVARAEVTGGLLAGWTVERRAALAFSDGALVDGGGVIVSGNLAGVARRGGVSALRERLVEASEPTRHRLEPLLATVEGISLALLPAVRPALRGPFVVSHNYAPLPRTRRDERCPGIPGYPSGMGGRPDARGGLRSLEGLLDASRPGCFDTAPFRTTHEYGRSLYAKLYGARGPYFGGCRLPEAANPDESRGCEGRR